VVASTPRRDVASGPAPAEDHGARGAAGLVLSWAFGTGPEWPLEGCRPAGHPRPVAGHRRRS